MNMGIDFDINWYKIDEFRKYAKIVLIGRHVIILIGILIRNILKS